MRLSPVSFGSIMVFTLKSGAPKAGVPQLIKATFDNNPALQNYRLQDNVVQHEEKMDGTVHNASFNFAKELDKKYEDALPKGSKKVILTKADFYINPTQTEEKYFLTAATIADEVKIQKVLGRCNLYYSARFNNLDKRI